MLNSCGVELGPRGFIVLTVNSFVCHFLITNLLQVITQSCASVPELSRSLQTSLSYLRGPLGDDSSETSALIHTNFTRVRSWKDAS